MTPTQIKEAIIYGRTVTLVDAYIRGPLCVVLCLLRGPWDSRPIILPEAYDGTDKEQELFEAIYLDSATALAAFNELEARSNPPTPAELLERPAAKT
jgi:hypothetical protein